MKMSLFRNACGGVLLVVASLALFLITGCQQAETSNVAYPATASPRLVDLGTPACIPCALMAPGLKELKTEYAGRLEVEVIDTLLIPGAKAQYNAPFCATQIYIAASGKELYRHVGYASKQDMLGNWKTLGIDLNAPAAQPEPKKAIVP
jgi:thioredoxin 1